MAIKLSILIMTVPSRLEYFYPRIMKQVLSQTEKYDNIEVLGFFDNKKRSVGTKRQDMLDLARGEYLVFIDDDDRITDDYVDSIIGVLKNNSKVDCIVFNSICCIENSSLKKLCKYGIEYSYGDINGGLEWRGLPAHTMVWKSEIAKKHRYSNMERHEDVDWVKRAVKDIKKQIRIDRVLYYYDANYKTTSETAGLSDKTIKSSVDRLIKKE